MRLVAAQPMLLNGSFTTLLLAGLLFSLTTEFTAAQLSLCAARGGAPDAAEKKIFFSLNGRTACLIWKK